MYWKKSNQCLVLGTREHDLYQNNNAFHLKKIAKYGQGRDLIFCGLKHGGNKGLPITTTSK